MHYLHTEINLFFSHFCTLYDITKMKECQQTFMNYSVFYSFRQKTLYILYLSKFYVGKITNKKSLMCILFHKLYTFFTNR